MQVQSQGPAHATQFRAMLNFQAGLLGSIVQNAVHYTCMYIYIHIECIYTHISIHIYRCILNIYIYSAFFLHVVYPH